MKDYATSKTAYRAIRNIIGPWAKANGYKRVPRTEASWFKSLSEISFLELAFSINRWGNSEHGTDFLCILYLGPCVGGAKLGSEEGKGAYINTLFDRAGIKEMEKVKDRIHSRWPIKPPERRDVKFRMHLLGGETIVPVSNEFMESNVSFCYYSVEDLMEWLSFILKQLRTTIATFLSANTNA